MKARKAALCFSAVLRTLCCLALFSAFYPLCALIVGGIFHLPYHHHVLLLSLLLEVFGFLGFTVGSLLQKRALRPALSKLFSALLLLASGSAAFFLLQHLSLFPALVNGFAALLLFGSCFAGILSGSRPYREILTAPVFTSITGLYLLSILILSLTKQELPINFFIGLYLFCAAVYAVSLNQNSIDFMMERRGHHLSHLPPKIRRYSLRILAVGFCLILLLVAVRGVFPPLMEAVGHGLRAALFALYQLIKALLPKGSATEGGAVSPDPNLSLNGGGGQKDTLLFYVITGLFFLALIVFTVKPLFRFFHAKFIQLFLFLRRWLNHSTSKIGSFSKESTDYSDLEETLPSEKAAAPPTPARAMRLWRRRLKTFVRMEDGPEKLRFGYALCVEGLALHGVPATPSDTTLTLLDRACQSFEGLPFAVATECYNALCYGKEKDMPDAALSSLISTIEQLRRRS